MSLVQKTLSILLEFLAENKIPPTQHTLEAETDLLRSQNFLPVKFLEWDPSRGMYYLEFDQPSPQDITQDFVVYTLEFPGYRDIFRFELNTQGSLTGVELQTRAPAPLPFLEELAHLLDFTYQENELTLENWKHYLKSSQSPDY